VWAWLLMFIALPFQVAGMFGAVAKMVTLALAGTGPAPGKLAALQQWEVLWVVLIGAVTTALLVAGRYRMVQNLSTAMVVLFTAFTCFALVTIQRTPYRITMDHVMEGLSFQLPSSFTVAFAAFGIIGVGASELIYYPFWCLEKGYARHTGPRDGSPGWVARARGWVRVMKLDAWISLVVYTGATVAFYLLGAAVLHGQGIVIGDDKGKVIDHLSQMYTQSYGDAGLLIFLLGGVCVLFSTIFAATASNARLLVNGLAVYRIKRAATEEQQARLVKFACAGLAMFSMGIYLLSGNVVYLVLIGGVAQALMLPFLAGAALYFRFKRHRDVAEDPARPGAFRWGTLLLALSALCMGAVGLYQMGTEIAKVLAK
jgi:manganese transport protein